MLNSFKDKRILIVGVGNTMRADDGVGPYIIKRLKEKNCRKELLDAGITPEDFTEEIAKLNPEAILIVDAARMGKKPGEIAQFDEDKIPETSISTHNISMRVVAALWRHLTNAQILFIGIEPENLDWEEKLSPVVKEAADALAEEFMEHSFNLGG